MGQVCIGGGLGFGASVGATLGGSVSGKSNSDDLRGWGNMSLSIFVGSGGVGYSAQGDSQGSASGSLTGTVGWPAGVAFIRCFSFMPKCSDNCVEGKE